MGACVCERETNLHYYLNFSGGKQSKEEILFELLVYNFPVVITFSSRRETKDITLLHNHLPES
jgi:hypothetical protein